MQTTVNLGQAFVTNLLNDPSKFDQVYMSRELQGYTLFNQIISKMNLNTGGSERVDNIKFERATLGGLEVYSPVNGASTINGDGNLVVTVDPTLNKFRETEIVSDNYNVQGRVVSKTNSTITLEPMSVTSWNAATHFTNGMIAAVVGQASKGKGSVGLDSLYNIPEYDFNYTQVMRESAGLFRRDNIKTYPIYGGKFWSHSVIDQALARFARKKESTTYFGVRALKNATNENDPNAVTLTGGIRWNIINRDPDMYYPLSTSIDFDTFVDIITEYKQKVPYATNIVAVMGLDFRRAIQTGITNNYIVQAGDKNTFGGMEVEGIDVNTFSANGIRVDFAIWKGFDAPERRGMISQVTGRSFWSHSCLLFCTDPIGNASGGAPLPAIVPVHFGANQYIAGFRKGLYDEPMDMGRGQLDGVVANMTNNGIVTDVDGITFDIYSDSGHWIQTNTMALIEPAN